MAYEHIDVSELKSSLRKLDNINNNKLKNLASSINAGDWSGNSRVRIVEALKTVSGYYDSIRSYLEKCKTAADYIDEYKSINNQNESYEAKIKKLQKSDPYSDGVTINKSQTLGKIEGYARIINNNQQKLGELQRKIDNLLGD